MDTPFLIADLLGFLSIGKSNDLYKTVSAQIYLGVSSVYFLLMPFIAAWAAANFAIGTR